MDLLTRWAGRHVAAAVRTTGSGRGPSVAVFRGRLGQAEDGRSGVFIPIRLNDDLEGPTGLHLKPAEFEDAVSDRGHLFLQVDGAVVELAPA